MKAIVQDRYGSADVLELPRSRLATARWTGLFYLGLAIGGIV